MIKYCSSHQWEMFIQNTLYLSTNKAQNKDLMTVEMEHSRGGMTVNTCKYLGSSLKSAFCNILHVRILLASVSCPGKNSWVVSWLSYTFLGLILFLPEARNVQAGADLYRQVLMARCLINCYSILPSKLSLHEVFFLDRKSLF